MAQRSIDLATSGCHLNWWTSFKASDESYPCASQRRISNKSSSGLGKLGTIMYYLHPTCITLYSIFYQKTSATHLDCRLCLRLRPATHASCDLCVPSLISIKFKCPWLTKSPWKRNIVTYGLHAVLFKFESFLLNGWFSSTGLNLERASLYELQVPSRFRQSNVYMLGIYLASMMLRRFSHVGDSKTQDGTSTTIRGVLRPCQIALSWTESANSLSATK